MRKILFIFLLLFLMFSCDPVESLEANILNNTSQDLKAIFVLLEASNFNETFEIESNNVKIIFEFGGVGDANLAFHDYDSIYITNTSNEVLKVYKADTPGKNIYNVDEYWQKREPSKNFFEYTYEITTEDIK